MDVLQSRVRPRPNLPVWASRWLGSSKASLPTVTGSNPVTGHSQSLYIMCARCNAASKGAIQIQFGLFLLQNIHVRCYLHYLWMFICIIMLLRCVWAQVAETLWTQHVWRVHLDKAKNSWFNGSLWSLWRPERSLCLLFKQLESEPWTSFRVFCSKPQHAGAAVTQEWMLTTAVYTCVCVWGTGRNFHWNHCNLLWLHTHLQPS